MRIVLLPWRCVPIRATMSEQAPARQANPRPRPSPSRFDELTDSQGGDAVLLAEPQALSDATSAASTQTSENTGYPGLRKILKHIAFSLLMANIIPGAIFYLCMRAGNIWTALIAALAWSYGSIAWRISTKRRTSGLLMIAVVGLTAKTLLALASGSTFIYFVQPAVNDAIIAMLFLLSLARARPIVAKVAGDFYPMNDELASRPSVQRLFWRLTMLWALICLGKAVATLWMLESLPLVTFVAVKSVLVNVLLVAGAAVSIMAAYRVVKSEGLLPHSC
ncbi:MAG TPA: VC0807 family protein [Mycobacteriales bacterium]|nr:VC0807 family protein [Mycobacteriales bacterium]